MARESAINVAAELATINIALRGSTSASTPMGIPTKRNGNVIAD
jgi:hypothetical protein